MARWRLIVGVLAALGVLTACGSNSPAAPTPIGEVTRPELVNLINWDRNPNTIVFRAEAIGGISEFFARNEVPYCTIYGDNRIVWTWNQGGQSEITAWDIASDEAIRLFVEDITLNDKIYEYSAGVNRVIDNTFDTSSQPTIERITLYVNDSVHQTDSFGGWELDFFQRILNKCRSISKTPIEFQPTGGWLTVQRVGYESDIPAVPWNNEISGVDFSTLANSDRRTWVEGDAARVIWDVLHRFGYDVQFEDEEGTTYVASFEVPGVTRDAPPAP